MRDLVPELGDRPVLVSGRGDVLNIARAYGFSRALHARELGAAMPTATPFTTYPPAPQRRQQQQEQQGRAPEGGQKHKEKKGRGGGELGRSVGSTEGREHASRSWLQGHVVAPTQRHVRRGAKAQSDDQIHRGAYGRREAEHGCVRGSAGETR